MSYASKPAIGRFTKKILAEREQIPLFNHSKDHQDDASGGVVVNQSPAPKSGAQVDTAPYTAGLNQEIPQSLLRGYLVKGRA